MEVYIYLDTYQHFCKYSNAGKHHVDPLNLDILQGLGCFFISSLRRASSSALRCWCTQTERRKTQSKKAVTNTLCFNPCTCLTNLICVSLQVLWVAPVSPYVTHAPLPRSLQQHTLYRWWNLFVVTELWGDGYQPCSAVSGRAGRPQVCLCLPCVWTGPPPLGDYKPLALYKNKWNLRADFSMCIYATVLASIHLPQLKLIAPISSR